MSRSKSNEPMTTGGTGSRSTPPSVIRTTPLHCTVAAEGEGEGDDAVDADADGVEEEVEVGAPAPPFAAAWVERVAANVTPTATTAVSTKAAANAMRRACRPDARGALAGEAGAGWRRSAASSVARAW